MNGSANYRTGKTPTWCPGCGNYLLLAALQQAFAEGKIPSHRIVAAYDIGCAGNMADFLKSYGVHALHGRAIPVAMGVKYSNPDLTVIAIGGDGGIYGEGFNHLVAATRANIEIKVFVSNNFLYSLTTGQASPTTPFLAKTRSTPTGVDLLPLDAIKVLKTVNPQIFAARTTNQNPQDLFSQVKNALSFPGFALVEVEQKCLAFGKLIDQG